MNRFLSILSFALLMAAVGGCKDDSKALQTTPDQAPAPKRVISNKPKLTKLVLSDVKLGTGKHAVASGDRVYVIYQGYLADDKEFDGTERHEGEPLSFTVGADQVIPGFDKGVLGMKVGGRRKMSIPAALAYGEKGLDPIVPPGSDLYYDVSLLGIVEKGDEDGVIIDDVKKGTGKVAGDDSTVTVHYVGTFITGKEFDSSRKRGKPMTFTFGSHEVVPGFEAGVKGMRVGGIRKIRVNPGAAYGSSEIPGIPANSILNFEVELLDVK